MEQRVFNFSPGPSTLPLSVLEKAQKELLSYQHSGISVVEMSHRGKAFLEIYNEAVFLLKELMDIPDTYEVLFLHGGASLQFSAIPLNLLGENGTGAYIDSGNFAYQALQEGKKFGKTVCLASSRDEQYTFVPSFSLSGKEAYDYLHITTNNTIYGTRFPDIPDTGTIPLIADASSNILSEPLPIEKFGIIYAGAQKNIGPSGMCVSIIRKDLLGKAREDCPAVMNWTVQAKAQSMYNTPSTFSIYMAKLGFEWLKSLGGVQGIEKINIQKAKLLYDFLDESTLFKGTADPTYRSRMNVTFTTPNSEIDEQFIKGAAAKGLVNLKGHRVVGGMRASIYNAMPIEGVVALVDFMKSFEASNPS
ncbi:MAG: 3-phosphoserine/phosphohydroxythreonine transaminase [Clostridiales bacterium]|nr:3-phosphoserine/phosphohydroxythreonine transaminase [Clostridiales bacterium]